MRNGRRSPSPLEYYFQLYGTTITRGLQREIQLEIFVAALVPAHGSRLKRFSLHCLPISLKALDGVCTGFTNLEHLSIVVEQEDLVGSCPRVCRLQLNEFQVRIGCSLSKAPKLQAVHINFTTVPVEDTDFYYVSPKDALGIVNQCSPTITQMGCASRVWKVSLASDIRLGEH